MQRRNWEDLSRKLVDRFDLLYTESAIDTALGELGLDSWGFGILQTRAYLNPMLVTRSGIDLSATLSPGPAYDEDGQRILVPTTQSFSFTPDPLLPRKALLVVRYKKTGDTPVPKPSNPITTIFLNLHDDFEVILRLGTPAASPSYPGTLAGDIIVYGYTIPAAETLASNCTEDDSVRQIAMPVISRLLQVDGELAVGDDVTTMFVLTKLPLDDDNLAMTLDGITIGNEGGTNWTRSGQNVTFASPPGLGQKVGALYLWSGFAPISGGGGGGSGAYAVSGDTATPVTVVAGVGVMSSSDQRQLLFVESTGGATPITANPQISPGSVLGQELVLVGTSDTDYIVLADGTGLSLNGSINMKNNVMILLIWNGLVWSEMTRR